MTVKTTNRKLGGLYGALSNRERARLLARFWRDGEKTELDRLRESIPDGPAGQAYNEALAILRSLNGALFLYGVMLIKVGFERDIFAAWMAKRAADQYSDHVPILWDMWKLVPYPVTESEYRAIVNRERGKLTPVSEYASELWENGMPDAIAELRPELAAIMREYREDMEEAVTDALWDRFNACFADAMKRGELPKGKPAPKNTTSTVDPDEPWLPAGVLKDWAKGTTSETYKPHGPGFTIPGLELLQAQWAEYDIQPDAKIEAVKERRAKLRSVLIGIGLHQLRIPKDQLEPLSFDPPKSAEEWQKAHDYVQGIWPYPVEERETFRSLAAQYAGKKAELRVYTDVLAMFQEEIFGGEDPLDTHGRELLEQAWAAARWAEETWPVLLDSAAPLGESEPWPPPLDNDEYYAVLYPQMEQRFREGGVG